MELACAPEDPMAAILVIDDEASMRVIIRGALERAGYQVVEAENGAAGLEALDGRDFDLIITDVLMPERDGVETVREIRRRRNPAKILVITGGGPHKRMEYLGVAEIFGADKSLAKPFRPAHLVSMVDEMLGAKGAGRSG
jgi:CheY-like chemotaxis protein